MKRHCNRTRVLSLLLCLTLSVSLLSGCAGPGKSAEPSAASSAAASEPEASAPVESAEESAAESAEENAEQSAAESAEENAEQSAAESAEENAEQSAAESAEQSAAASDASAQEPEQEAEVYTYTGEDGYTLSNDASDFVLLSDAVPDAMLEIRYYSTYNFIGDRVDGYEQPVALLTKEAASALSEVSDELKDKGYRLKIFDAYRPQAAVSHFVRWAEDLDDTRMKPYFYPELDKSVLFEQGYIAAHSGHSRGSTVDLTLFDMTTEREVDMGGTFDYFGELSHPDYTEVTESQYELRMLLRDVMVRHGFRPLSEEWWHFTLENEPYPDTYFTFPVNEKSVK